MLPSDYISGIYNPNDYTNSSGNLTIDKADLRYNKIYADNYASNLFTTGSLYQNDTLISLNYLTSITPGTAIVSKALITDSSNNIAGINSLSANFLRATRTASGQSFNSTCGTSSCVLYHYINGDCYFGTYAANNFILQTNNTPRMTINSNGTITGISSLTATSLIGTNLSITGTGELFRLSNGTITLGCSIDSGLSFGTTSNHNFVLKTNDLARMTLSNSGVLSLSSFTASTGPGEAAFIVGGGISINSTTDALSSTNGGGLTIAGGAAVAKKLYVGDAINSKSLILTDNTAHQLIITNTNSASLATIKFIGDTGRSFELGLRGTASSPNSNFYIYDNINSTMRLTMHTTGLITFNSTVSISDTGITAIANSTGSSSNTTGCLTMIGGIGISNTSDASSSTNGGTFTTAGGAAIAKKLYVGSDAYISGNMTLNTPTPILRVGTSSSAELCIGTSHSGPPGCNLAINTTGQPLRFICDNNSGTETAWTNFTASNSGFMSFNVHANDMLNTYTFTNKGFIGLRNNTPNYRLDFGANSDDYHISIYQHGAPIGTCGMGYNSSTNTMNIATASGNIRFYNSTTNGNLGTNTATIYPSGDILVSRDVLSTRDISANRHLLSTFGCHAYGATTTGLTSLGAGAHMQYSTSLTRAEYFGYNYNADVYVDMSLGNQNMYIVSSGSGNVGIGTSSPAVKLHVVGTSNQTNAASFGYLTSIGASTATGFTNRAFSIRSSGGILIDSGEIDVFSDVRLKDNIADLSSELCDRFIDNINPISFNYKNNEQITNYGFSAQELMKFGFDKLVGFTHDENDDLTEMEVECENGDVITLEKHTRLVVNLLDMIPILTKTIKLERMKFDRLLKALPQSTLKKYRDSSI